MANNTKRYRITIPEKDKSVWEWFNEQENPSMSIRQLVKESIQKEGIIDIMAREVVQLNKVGRKSNAEKEAMSEQDDFLTSSQEFVDPDSFFNN